MKAEEQKDAALAKETGDPSKTFLLAASDAQLSEAAAVLKREGNATANELFHELVESHEIYLKNMQGSPESNSQRARLMKQHFQRDFDCGGIKIPTTKGCFSNSAIGTFTKASTLSTSATWATTSPKWRTDKELRHSTSAFLAPRARTRSMRVQAADEA